jgi:hypothetical protein
VRPARRRRRRLLDLATHPLSPRAGSKNPGIIALEHELSDQSVQSFKDNWPKFAQRGWSVQSLARLSGRSAYQTHNADLFE